MRHIINHYKARMEELADKRPSVEAEIKAGIPLQRISDKHGIAKRTLEGWKRKLEAS